MPLPIESALPELHRVLSDGHNAVLTAPPGAGKTTVVPLSLLQAIWLRSGSVLRKVIMLEPRRLAARAAAYRMASLLGEAVGGTVGYRMRLDTKVGPHTRIEVVTEAILSRLLQHDPSLSEYGAAIFDEFHERSLQADVGLALSLDSQRLFRPDLRILIMSATVETSRVATLLGRTSGEAAVISCEGRPFPTEVHYLDHPLSGQPGGSDPLRQTLVQIAQTIHRALREDVGNVLVFLPGMAEIRRVERQLRDGKLPPHVIVAPLHGDLPYAQQEVAILPPPSGRRKVVLSSSIAESSLTIEGISVVIDAGLMRVSRFDARTALTRLETVRVTQDAAEQRRGRAGRLRPGVCYRLWTIAEQQRLIPHRLPEILEADLAPLVLELAAWGTTNLDELSWLDAPPSSAVSQAKALLTRLGALDEHGQITPHGRVMADAPIHPRLSHMIVAAMPLGQARLACELAALLSERDVLRMDAGGRQADLRLRLDALQGQQERGLGAEVDRPAVQRVRELSRLIQQALSQKTRRTQHPPTATLTDNLRQQDHAALGVLLSFAYPDRIAQRQSGSDRRYLLANGRGARFFETDALATEDYVVVVNLNAEDSWASIFLAAPITLDDIEHYCAEQIHEERTVQWDNSRQAVQARVQRRLGALVLQDRPIRHADPEQVRSALIEALRQRGVSILPWTKDLRQWQARITLAKRIAPTAWPEVGDAVLTERLADWLGPFLDGMTRLDQVQSLDLSGPLHALLTWEQQRELDRLAPTHVTVPSGSRVRLEYDAEEGPVLAVRLQEMFGCRETPRVADGMVPVIVHLLSPAGRPVQVTQDLRSFWASAYQDVRKELRGRYPKHHWPEDPLTARPSARAKRRSM